MSLHVAPGESPAAGDLLAQVRSPVGTWVCAQISRVVEGPRTDADGVVIVGVEATPRLIDEGELDALDTQRAQQGQLSAEQLRIRDQIRKGLATEQYPTPDEMLAGFGGPASTMCVLLVNGRAFSYGTAADLMSQMPEARRMSPGSSVLVARFAAWKAQQPHYVRAGRPAPESREN